MWAGCSLFTWRRLPSISGLVGLHRLCMITGVSVFTTPPRAFLRVFSFSFPFSGPNFLLRLLLGSYDYVSAAERPLLLLSSAFSSVAGFRFQVLISVFPSAPSPFGLPLCPLLLDLFSYRLPGHGCCCRSWGRSPGSCTTAFAPALATSSSS